MVIAEPWGGVEMALLVQMAWGPVFMDHVTPRLFKTVLCGFPYPEKGEQEAVSE